MSVKEKIRQEAKSFDELVGMMEDIDEKYIGDEEVVPTNKIDAYVKESDEFGNKQWVSVDVVLKILEEQQKKLQELADLLKNRPKIDERTRLGQKRMKEWFLAFEKKFVELFSVESTKKKGEKPWLT